MKKKIKNIALGVFLQSTIIVSYAQNYEWAQAIGGTGTEQSNSIVVDASGNVYTTGRFNDTVDFDSGSGSATLTSNGGFDIFISKLDANGNFIWAKAIGGTGWDKSTGIALDASGNVYITGFFNDTVDFNPGSGTANLISNGGLDIFISKLDANGNFIWAKTIGGTDTDGANAITIDTYGNIYITGFFNNTVDFNTGSGISNLTSNGLSDIFVLKIDPLGNFIWAKAMGGFGYDNSTAIILDASGNAYLTGSFEETVDFDPGSGTANLTSIKYEDIFISKLDASGNFVWAKSMGGMSTDEGYNIILNTYGSIYITGVFEGTVDFDPGSGTTNLTSNGYYNIFISKLNASGNFVWAKSIERETFFNYSIATTLDASGNIYTTGSFETTVDFDPGPGTTNLTSNGAYDIFINKLDSSGNFVWAKAIGSGGSDDFGYAITLDASENLYTTGSFQETADFDPGSGTANLTSNGNYDFFILKLSSSTVGIKESSLLQGLSLYPNPTKGKVELSSTSNVVSIKVFSIEGQLLLQKNNNLKETDLSSYKKGFYLFSITDTEGRIVTKRIERM